MRKLPIGWVWIFLLIGSMLFWFEAFKFGTWLVWPKKTPLKDSLNEKRKSRYDTLDWRYHGEAGQPPPCDPRLHKGYGEPC